MPNDDAQKRIRAIHVLRDDHAEHVGGDIAELHGVVAGLQLQGIEAVATTLTSAPSDVDVVHLYNLWLPRQLIRAEADARRRWPRARVAITPIFGRFPLRQVAAVRERDIGELALRRAAMARLTWLPIRRALRRADLIVTKHHPEADLLARFYRLGDGRPIALLPNGTWTEHWQSDRSPIARAAFMAGHRLPADAQPLVACIARVEPRKNQLRLIQAVAELPSAALVLVGPAAAGYGERVLGLAGERLAGRFAWLDRQPQPVVRQVLGAADVHALPSFLEIHCTADIEAAAAGCAIVVTATPATDELWGDLVHGCLPHSPMSIRDAIQDAVESPHQPGLAERASAFGFDVLGERVAAIYRKFLT
ncbi:MAG: glycosyltransferase family 4 protein [Acidimicrobiales bacterium]